MANILKSWETKIVKQIFNLFNQFIRIKSFFLKNSESKKSFIIMTLPHTVYIANSLKVILENKGLNTTIEIKSRRKLFPHDFYIVICPQEFKYLPPPKKRISLQMEQCVSNWFNEKYIDILNSSIQVWDYSKRNIDYLKQHHIAIDKIFYIPVCGVNNYRNFLELEYGQPLTEQKTTDFLFYGNINSSRRKKLLDSLSKHFSVKIENNLYGYEMLNAICNSKIVVNIHFYEGALLETTRIFECLSLGVKILSESSTDIDDYEYLNQSSQIAFFKINDGEDMVKQAEILLKQDDDKEDDCLKQSQQILEKNINLALSKIIPIDS